MTCMLALSSITYTKGVDSSGSSWNCALHVRYLASAIGGGGHTFARCLKRGELPPAEASTHVMIIIYNTYYMI